MTVDFSDSYANVPGGSVFVRRWNAGASDRAPIVLLHDSLGCVDLWRDFPASLCEITARPVIAYDRLGFGRSQQLTQRPSADFIQQDAEAFFVLASELRVDDFLLFGHSVGGGIALTIAASSGERCGAVITESAQAFVEPRTLSGIRAAKENFSDPEQLAKLARWHGEKARWVLEAWTEVWLSPDFASWSLDGVLNRIECPVLTIHGDQDEFGSTEFPRRIAAGVSGPSELAILEDCGHVPHREKREMVLSLTSSFMHRQVII
jgi:pimeloyl-ACP methyl ester carboxylesterase